MVTLDALIDEVGSCGLFQALLLVFLHSTNVLAAWGMLHMVFGGYDPGWKCVDRSEDIFTFTLNISSTGIETTTSAQNHTNHTVDQCEKFRSCQNISFTPGSSTIVTEWNLVCGDEWIPKTITTIQMAGVIVGSYVSGHLSDRFGRRLTLYGMVALHAVFNFAAAFSPSWQVFALMRFLIGFAVGGMIIAMSTLPVEFLSEFWRGVNGALPTWNIGTTLFSIAVMVLRDWRQLHLLTAALSVILFFPVFWVPESLRWLAVHDKDKQAEIVARRIARINRRPRPSSTLLARVADNERQRANKSGNYSYLDLFIRGGKRLRRHTIFMALIWIGLAFVYYGLNFGIQAISGDFYINFIIFSVAEILGSLFVVPAIHLLGRRWGSVAHFCVASLVCGAAILVTLLMDSKSHQQSDEMDAEDRTKGKIVMALAFISKMMIVGAWSAVFVFTGELFPTVVRSLAFGFFGAASRLGAMLGPFLFPQDSDLLYVGLAETGTVALLCTILVLALPETKGAALQDTLAREGGDGGPSEMHDGYSPCETNPSDDVDSDDDDTVVEIRDEGTRNLLQK